MTDVNSHHCNNISISKVHKLRLTSFQKLLIHRVACLFHIREFDIFQEGVEFLGSGFWNLYSSQNFGDITTIVSILKKRYYKKTVSWDSKEMVIGDLPFQSGFRNVVKNVFKAPGLSGNENLNSLSFATCESM